MQRKLFLLLTALLMLAGMNGFASKIIYQTGVTGKTAAFNCPESCVGHQATIWSIGFKRGENITVTLTFAKPGGDVLASAMSNYNNSYGNSSKMEQAVLNYNFTIEAGTYTLTLGGNSESENIAQISNVLVICWDCPGDDIAGVQTELTTEINALKAELEGAVNTQMTELQTQISALQTQLNDVITKHDADQAALLRQIETFEREITNLAADLQYNVARLERQQADYLAQLEVVKIAHEKDVEMLNLKISNLDSKYASEVANIKSDVATITGSLAALDAKFLAADQQLKTLIASLESQHAALQQQVNSAEQQHKNDMSAIQSQIDAKTELIRSEHSADVKRLEDSISMVDGKYEAEVAGLNAGQSKTDSALAQAVRDYTAADSVLQSKIDALTAGQSSLQNELSSLTAAHSRDAAEIKALLETRTAQLETRHGADVKLLEQSISDLDTRYQGSTELLNSNLTQTNSRITQLERDYQSGDTALKDQIDSLKQTQTAQQNALTLLETEHNRDIAALRGEYTAKYEQMQAAHTADVNLLTLQMNNLNSTYAEKTSQINTRLDSINSELLRMARDYTNGDKELKEQIDALRLQQLTQQNALNNLTAAHNRDAAALQTLITEKNAALQEKIDGAVADLRMDMVTLDNKYKDATADLKAQLAEAGSKLDTEVAKLETTDRDLYDNISDLREKQADYYARMEVLKVTHEKDVEAIEKEIAGFDKKYQEEVEAINAKIAAVKADVAALETKHNEDVAKLKGEIASTVDKLDDEVRKIYLELTAQKEELAAHKQATRQAIDNLQLRITELDKSVTERLKNLENRIKYAVYSDEKLEALKKDFKAQIQAKEKEIADLDLEIQDMKNAGLDTSAKEETRTRLLKELLALRNELTDIEFAIAIRHDESEFAEHEKEITLLKTELAALRSSTDLQIKQLKDDLLATEEKYLKLLEEAKADAANQTASVQKQLDKLKNQVLIFVAALRDERESGDAELKVLLETMDVSHKELIGNLDKTIADKLDKLKFETDTQFENLRSTINNIAYQQRAAANGSGTSYSLPGSQVQDVPADTRDLRVSPDVALNSTIN